MTFFRIKRSPLLISIPFWLLFMSVDLLKKTNLDISSPFFLYFYIPGLILWMVLTDPIYRLFKKLKKLRIGIKLVVIGVLGPVFGFTKAWANILVSSLLGTLMVDRPFQFGLPKQFYVMEASIIAWILLIVFLFIEVYSDYQKRLVAITRLETDLKNAELNALKMQIQPHFLFNTHNAIASLLRADKSKPALEMLLKLSDLLRVSLSSFDYQFVPLHQELAFVKNYLDIEKVRFEERLEVEIDNQAADPEAEVPVFSLQPLIENGIKHGVSKNMGDSLIKISVFPLEDGLKVVVFNTGVWESTASKDGGVGLSNLRNRLDNLFGEKASLNLQEVSGGVEAMLILPHPNHKKNSDEGIDHR